MSNLMRIIILSLFSLSLFASEKKIAKNEIVSQDLYLANDKVVIDGLVNGNVFVFGANVEINGTVFGNVYCVAGECTLAGSVLGNFTSLAAQINIDGIVGKRMNVFCASFDSTDNAQIKGESLIFAGNCDLKGLYNDDLSIYSSYCKLNAIVKNELNIHTGQLYIDENAQFSKLSYWSENRAILKNKELKKKILYHPTLLSRLQNKWLTTIKLSSIAIFNLMGFAYSFVIGLILMRFYPTKIKKSIHAIQTKPIKTFFNGLIILFCLPLLAIALLITIVGVPFALTLIAVNVLGFYIAKVIAVLWFASRLKLMNSNPRAKFFCCLLGYFFLTMIPYLGFTLTIIATLFGIGSVITSNRNDLVSLEKH